MPEEKGILRRISDVAATASGSLKGAVDLAKEVNALQVDYNVKTKTIDLLDMLVDARTSQFELTELLDEAKNKIIELENLLKTKHEWDSQKLDYELYHPIPSTVVYRLKPSDGSEYQPHYLCVKCYEFKVKSILQYKTSNAAFTTMCCHNCQSEYKFPLEYQKQKKTPDPLGSSY
ncbi:hypothetical protein JK211_16130 [Tatumella sp. JGM130]|nr:hypothetical protein [Tatumella sp. JGM130]MBS0895528.1 hypothetical protein [Tatumella sp. JGM130]